MSSSVMVNAPKMLRDRGAASDGGRDERRRTSVTATRTAAVNAVSFGAIASVTRLERKSNAVHKNDTSLALLLQEIHNRAVVGRSQKRNTNQTCARQSSLRVTFIAHIASINTSTCLRPD
jgi:hypothetical protein